NCGGVTINPGDIVVGDQDGVVAVPLAEAQAVAKQLKEVERREAQAEAKVRRGEKLKFWNPAALGDRVRYLD
ncbi:MAG TPA: RraA family protein, partial [Burkholderiales bacterium]|nr:RraA family protein [Burkholderiales bacterium]